MEPTARSNPARNLLVRLLLLGVFFLVSRFLYVVIVHGESCDAADFCFFSSSTEGFTIAGTGAGVGTGAAAFVRGGGGDGDGSMTNPGWSSREWRKAVDYYSAVFQDLIVEGFLSSTSKSLCVQTPAGQEVFALKEIGVPDAIGISKKKAPPLVVSGNILHQPFGDRTFDFIFSGDGTIEQSKQPSQLASELARTLKPEGFLVVHTSSAGDLYSLNSFLGLFPSCRLVRKRAIDDPVSKPIRQIVLQKEGGSEILWSGTKEKEKSNFPAGGSSANKCSIPGYKLDMVRSAEPLIKEEPLKPWITLKKNAKNIEYLPSMADISFQRRYVYIDVGARSYGSSIGSWFKKQYPKQNHTFEVYAIEADRAFHSDYVGKKGVTLLPYAAWVRNETLSFEINRDPDDHKADAKGRGMGRIRPSMPVSDSSSSGDVDMIQGFDFAEWLKRSVSKSDFVVMKMDVEGTEFDLIPRLFKTGAIFLIDELFLECHYNRWQRCCPGVRTPKYKKTYGQCLDLFSSLRKNGILVHQWW